MRRLGGRMPQIISDPAIVHAAGNMPRRIEEYVGRASTGHATGSVARMRSPQGWQEPGQRPEFAETSLVLRGVLRVEHESGFLDVGPGKPLSSRQASGCGTALPRRVARSTWRSAYLRSRSRPPIAIRPK